MARDRRFALAVLGAVAVAAVVAAPIGSAAGLFGPAADMPGAEPGTEKERLILEAQQQYERSARATVGPVVGRPREQWHPEIVEGIIEGADSPFEGASTFLLGNMWQSRLSAGGRVTRVYAGTDGPRSLLIITRHRLMTGERELYREIELPRGVGGPRLTRMTNGVLEVETATGRSFRLDVAGLALR